MVAKRLVDPHGQRTTLEDGARPSKSVASSHKSRARRARDKKGLRERKGEMGDGKQRKQCKHLESCLLLSQCKYTSSSSDGALAMILFVRAASVTTRLEFVGRTIVTKDTSFMVKLAEEIEETSSDVFDYGAVFYLTFHVPVMSSPAGECDRWTCLVSEHCSGVESLACAFIDCFSWLYMGCETPAWRTLHL